MSQRLKMDDETVEQDRKSLERYFNKEIDFDQLKMEIEEHNNIEISNSRLNELLLNTGYYR